MKSGKNRHAFMGPMSKHHLIPKRRLRDYYGNTFRMPRNTIRMWRLRHDAWHVLFRHMTINETLRYLYRKREEGIYGYQSVTWKIVFGEKTWQDAYVFLKRLRRMKRKQYSFFEFEPTLQRKALRIEKETCNREFVRIYLDKKFAKTG